MKVNRYVDITTVEKDAKKDYIDRHSPFVHCTDSAVKGEPFKVKVKMGEEYKHPDDFDHYISWIQLWDGENMLAQTTYTAGAQGGEPANAEVEFQVIPTKKMKLTAMSFCTKHGLWQSDEFEVGVN